MPGRGVSMRHWPAYWPVDLGETAHLPAALEGFSKAVEIHLAAGQESLQEVDPALLEVLRDRGAGLGREPAVVHASRLSPDARSDIRAGPAPGPEAHLQFARRGATSPAVATCRWPSTRR